jgi:hypothetical protein
MSYPINYPTPQGANVQIFTANTNAAADDFSATWVKPQGASMVWFTLIGAGGGGGDADSDGVISGYGGGGGSGAVTNCMMPAFLIPDILQIQVYAGVPSNDVPNTNVFYQQKNGTGYLLLEADSGAAGGFGNSAAGAGGAGGSASTSSEFSAAGFFQSIAGQSGATGNDNLATSTTTFLQGGGAGSASIAASQYGYGRNTATFNQYGYAMMSPILVSVGSTQTGSSFISLAEAQITKNGFGSGGGGASITSGTDRKYGGRGGDGLCVIVTW